MGEESDRRIDLAELVGREYKKSLLEGDSRLTQKGMKHHGAGNFDLHFTMKSSSEENTLPEKHVMVTVRDGIIRRCVILPMRLYISNLKSEVG